MKFVLRIISIWICKSSHCWGRYAVISTSLDQPTPLHCVLIDDSVNLLLCLTDFWRFEMIFFAQQFGIYMRVSITMKLIQDDTIPYPIDTSKRRNWFNANKSPSMPNWLSIVSIYLHWTTHRRNSGTHWKSVAIRSILKQRHTRQGKLASRLLIKVLRFVGFLEWVHLMLLSHSELYQSRNHRPTFQRWGIFHNRYSFDSSPKVTKYITAAGWGLYILLHPGKISCSTKTKR